MPLHRNKVVTLSRRNNGVIIDLIHKYHNAQVPHPTMHHFVTEMCTCVHFSVAEWCIVGHLSNALWDLWDGSIALCVRWDRTTLPLRPRLHYIKHTVHWLHCSGCWFHLGSAYLHITSLVTSGNSGLPRPNSSRKSSDIPLPTQSPIWVNPMGPITLIFGKKCRYSLTTPGDNLQISSTKRAFIECMFLPRRLRSDWLPTGIPVNETPSQQSARAACTQCSAWRCCVALFDVNKPAPVAAVQ